MNYPGILTVLFVSSLAGCAAQVGPGLGDSDPDEGPFAPPEPAILETPSLESLAAAEAQAGLGVEGQDIEKTVCVVPQDFADDVLIASMGMGRWHSECDLDFCQNGTVGASFAIKSLPEQPGGDDLANTGVALGCHNINSGAFVHWVLPKGQGNPAGGWDNATSSCFLRGGNFALLPGPQPFIDDKGVTDGAGWCANGGSINVNVNNPAWGSWQGWRSCPSGTRVCGIAAKFDHDNGPSDDAGLTGVRFACCHR